MKRAVTCSLMSSLVLFGAAFAEPITIPTQTVVYVETDQPVSGKKKHTQEGQVVRATVWRDVDINGRTVIKAGTPVLVRVDTLKGAKIAGIKGKMSLGAYDTTAVDGSKIELGGGYLKEGSGRIVLTATLAALVFLPLIFIKGKSADLPRGTVFDAFTKGETAVDTAKLGNVGPRIDLSKSMGPRLEAEVLYDELSGSEKPENFVLQMKTPVGSTGKFVVDSVNGVKIEALEIKSKSTGIDSDIETWRGEIQIKDLGKEFKKGINTFGVATEVNGERIGDEVVLDIQF